MIICEWDIILIMLQCTEVRILSIITAIFQAIGQALSFIFPLSESGHSAIFNDFSARYSGIASLLTGLVHIGIALGIIAAFYKLFIRVISEFFFTWKDIFKKKFSVKTMSNRRKFMLYTFIPYLFMLIYAIPAGNKTNVYGRLHALSYDGNLLSEGICFLISGLLIFFASFVLTKNDKGKQLTLPTVLAMSVAIFFTIPIAGLSLSVSIIMIAILMGTNRNVAIRYFAIVAAPVLIVQGIIQAVTAVVSTNAAAGIIGVILSAVAAYLACAFLRNLVKNNKLNFFAYYSFAIGLISTVIGIVEIIVK